MATGQMDILTSLSLADCKIEVGSKVVVCLSEP